MTHESSRSTSRTPRHQSVKTCLFQVASPVRPLPTLSGLRQEPPEDPMQRLHGKHRADCVNCERPQHR
jgi:hypothetical protein